MKFIFTAEKPTKKNLLNRTYNVLRITIVLQYTKIGIFNRKITTFAPEIEQFSISSIIF